MKPFLPFLTVCVLFLVVGCAQSPASLPPLEAVAATETPMPRQLIPQTPPPTEGISDGSEDMPPSTQNAGIPSVAQIAIRHLAEKLQISADQIQITAVEAVTWPDSSLGCPQPNGMYLQVLTPGFNLTLEANGTSYPYHTDSGETVVLCGSGAEKIFIPTP
ncbi:MAG TPA: hypothetical protein PKL78_00910 [Anaerolineales bacterium]|nr:hypothetical protein [Anaerolineales bacterium]HNN12086.1 hypothetical protein [Anaerolineales bacterium]HNO32282.1 hypothetical protein [Anaerolineales bacterium]